jgi:hypothetical protein
MKKGLLLFALVMILAGGLFAQTFTWSGVFNSGLGLVSGGGDEDPYISAYGVDAGVNGYRFRLNGGFVNADGTAGVNFRIQSQNRLNPISSLTLPSGEAIADNGGIFSLPYAYGYITLLNETLTLKGGMVDDGTWATGGFLADDVGEGLGILARLSPIKGLDLGLGAYLLTPNSGGSNNSLPVPDLSAIGLNPGDLKYTVGLGYTLPDVFKAVLSYRSKNKTLNGQSGKLMASLSLPALKPLTLILDAGLDNLDAFGDKGLVEIHENIAYPLGDLTLGFNAGEYIRNTADSDLAIRLNPYVSYALGSMVPRLEVVYFIAGSSSFPAYSYAAFGANYQDDRSLLSIRPSVKIKIDGNTTLELGDLIAIDRGPQGTYAAAGDPARDTRMSNVFYLDLNWKF